MVQIATKILPYIVVIGYEHNFSILLMTIMTAKVCVSVDDNGENVITLSYDSVMNFKQSHALWRFLWHG